MKRHFRTPSRSLPRINLRPILFCALGTVFGVFLYTRVRFGGLAPSDFLIVGALFLLALVPLSWRRFGVLCLTVFLFAAVGAGVTHLYTEAYLSGLDGGNCIVTGTVTQFAVKGGYTSAVLTGVTLDGHKVGGKLLVTLPSEEVRAGDKVSFSANVRRGGLPPQDEYDYTNNIRYRASASAYEQTGTSKNPFLLLNSYIYDLLQGNMEGEEADLAYALLTGNSQSIDSELLTAIRMGGIAHIFAVSGMHIGILYAAAKLLFRPIGRWASFPALFLALCYCAFCGFTVSSVRAVIMCGVLALWEFFGQKYDLIGSMSFAAILILVFRPAQWISAGFRLSFGAVAGLALFAGSFSRGFARLHIPTPIAGVLSATYAVQIFTFPILYEAFGYFSLWGLLLNPLLVPLLPVVFLTLIFCTLISLIAAPAAAFFLQFPAGLLALLLLLFSVVDFSAVLTGFALGAGGAVFTTGAILLSERVRMGKLLRGVTALVAAVVFALCIFLENAVLYGCKIVVYESEEGEAALIRTSDSAVLVIDGDITLTACRSFLRTNYGSTLDGVIVLSNDCEAAVNVAIFLDAEVVFMRNETDMGTRETVFSFGEAFSVGDMQFRYENDERLTLFVEGLTVELDFERDALLPADLFVGKGCGGLKYFLNRGIIRKL